MRFRRPTTAYLVALAAILAGCRSSSGDAQALIRENQQREEYALQLQVQLDQCCRELRACREELAAKEQQASTSGTRRGGTREDESSPSDKPRPPKVDLGTPGGGKEPTPAPKFEPSPKYEPGSK